MKDVKTEFYHHIKRFFPLYIKLNKFEYIHIYARTYQVYKKYEVEWIDLKKIRHSKYRMEISDILVEYITCIEDFKILSQYDWQVIKAKYNRLKRVSSIK